MTQEYCLLGRTGLRVSRLALGTMTFGEQWGFGCDEATARTLFDRYLEAGGNFIDTADAYTGGTSERWLGRCIADAGVRDHVVLATKYSFTDRLGNPNAGGNHRKNLLRALDASLERLGTDYIDLYIMHLWDRLTPIEEVLRTLDDQVRAGRIRHYALSDVPAWYAARAQTLAEARGWEPVAALQLEYSLAERNIEREHIPAGLALGMGVMAWSPLCSGLLSGKYRADGQGAHGGQGRLSAAGRGGLEARLTPRNLAILAELERVSRALERPMAEVALNWVANRPGVASVIVGATRAEQLDSNLRALDFDLPPEHHDALDAASAPRPQFPEPLFSDPFQRLVHGNTDVADRPPGYDDGTWITSGDEVALPFIAEQASRDEGNR